MNVRTITIALIALAIVSVIGNAVIVRELHPQLANSSGTGTAGTDAKAATTERIAPDSGRGRANGSTRSGRNPVAVRTLARRQASSVERLTRLAQADDPRWL